MVAIIVETYEVVDGQEILTVRHTFYGSNLERALAIERAHRKTDEFYRGAVTRGQWKTIRLVNEAWVDRGSPPPILKVFESGFEEIADIDLDTGGVIE